jgi:hypothetical protein
MHFGHHQAMARERVECRLTGEDELILDILGAVESNLVRNLHDAHALLTQEVLDLNLVVLMVDATRKKGRIRTDEKTRSDSSQRGKESLTTNAGSPNSVHTDHRVAEISPTTTYLMGKWE